MVATKPAGATTTTDFGAEDAPLDDQAIAALEQALQAETDPKRIARHTFRLSLAYRERGDTPTAYAGFCWRAAMGQDPQEVFLSLLYAGRLAEALNLERDSIIALYKRASETCPDRVEALHAAGRLCRLRGDPDRAVVFGKLAIRSAEPPPGSRVEAWIYDYGALAELALSAYLAGDPRTCLETVLRAFQGGKVPAEEHARLFELAQAALRMMGPGTTKRQPPGWDGWPFNTRLAMDTHAPVLDHFRPARLPSPAPRVLVAILAKQKEPVLPLYLDCLEALDYPKSSIVLYIRTNNNTDRTAALLRAFVSRVGSLYAGVEFDDSDVPEPVERFGVHEWNPTRFHVLGAIRDTSLAKARDWGCAFYFVADVDNFVGADMLRELVALNLPIVAPLLRHVDPLKTYSNYHADIAPNGYAKTSAAYYPILYQRVRGVFELPVVHCTYLIRADVLPDLTYSDRGGRHEYVVFSERARAKAIPQYFDNRRVYGYVTLEDDDAEVIGAQIARARALLLEPPRAAG